MNNNEITSVVDLVDRSLEEGKELFEFRSPQPESDVFYFKVRKYETIKIPMFNIDEKDFMELRCFTTSEVQVTLYCIIGQDEIDEYTEHTEEKRPYYCTFSKIFESSPLPLFIHGKVTNPHAIDLHGRISITYKK